MRLSETPCVLTVNLDNLQVSRQVHDKKCLTNTKGCAILSENSKNSYSLMEEERC